MKNKNIYGSLIVLIAVLAVTTVYGVGSVYARGAENGRRPSGNSGFDSARDIAERGAGVFSLGVHVNEVKLRGDGTVDDNSADSGHNRRNRGSGNNYSSM